MSSTSDVRPPLTLLADFQRLLVVFRMKVFHKLSTRVIEGGGAGYVVCVYVGCGHTGRGVQLKQAQYNERRP